MPWYHHIALLDKLKTRDDRLWYAQKAIEHNWSRNILLMQIESRLIERSGAAVTNFTLTLPKPESDLARESLKIPTGEIAARRITNQPAQHRADRTRTGGHRISGKGG